MIKRKLGRPLTQSQPNPNFPGTRHTATPLDWGASPLQDKTHCTAVQQWGLNTRPSYCKATLHQDDSFMMNRYSFSTAGGAGASF